MKKHFPALGVLVVMIGISLFYLRVLPNTIPTKFDVQGNPTQFVSKFVGVSMIPAIYILILTTLPAVLRLSRKEFNNPLLLAKTLFSLGLMLLSVHYGMLADSFKANALPLWLSLGVGLFMISIAPTLETSERNPFIGVRTPWSLASEANWKATHRFAAKLIAITGLFVLVMSMLARPSMVIAIGSLIFSTTIPVFYSYWYYQNMEKKS